MTRLVSMKRETLRALMGLSVLLAFFTLAENGIVLSARGTEPQSSEEPSASSLMEMRTPGGRIGEYRYNGAFAPTPGVGSRFTNSARYGSAGNIVGLDPARAGSRFQGGDRRFQSRMNYDALRTYTEFRRLDREGLARGSDAGGAADKPRLVVASPPARLPKSGVGRAPRYGMTREELAAAQARAQLDAETLAQWNAFQSALNGLSRSAAPQVDSPSTGEISPAAPQQIWMRGRAQQTSESFMSNPDAYDPFSAYDASLDYGQNDYAGYDEAFGNLSSNVAAPVAGAIGTLGEVGATALPPTRVMTPAETKALLEEYFELQLLRSPDVNPLSPIQVDFQGGIATIRGVVPTPSARVAAGNILLADPRVTRVNNMTTYVREEDGSPATAPTVQPSSPPTPQQ